MDFLKSDQVTTKLLHNSLTTAVYLILANTSAFVGVSDNKIHRLEYALNRLGNMPLQAIYNFT